MSDDPNGPRMPDAFPLTADPATYFPRLALESALAELVESLAEAPACAALIGEPGLGKTLLLHVLEERLEGAYECVYLPYPRLDGPELWAWVASAMGLRRSEDDRAAVLRRARRYAEDGKGLVLLVDDAGSLLPEPRIELIHACRSPGFSLVMAFTSEDHEQVATLPPHVRRIDLGPPMTLAETRAYVRARLRRVDPAGVIAARLGPARMAELHEASEGIPARLHALLDAWLRNTPVAQSEVGSPAPVQASAAEPRPSLAPVPMPAPPPTPVAVEHRQFFARRKRARAPLALLALLLSFAAGFWLVTRWREPEATRPEPAPAETAPAATVETTQEPIPAAAPEAAEVAPPPEAPAEAAPAPTPEAAPEPAEASEVSPPAAEPIAVEPPAPAPAPPARPAPPAVAEQPRTALDTPALAPPPRGPRLSVNAQPWADIELDGKPVGQTPLGDVPISPGSHLVKAKLPDGRVLERRVDARAGDLYVVFP